MDGKKPLRKNECPDCEELGIAVPENVEVGDILECENCAAEAEVVSVVPLKLRLIVEEK